MAGKNRHEVFLMYILRSPRRVTWWRKVTRGRTGLNAGLCWSPAASPTTLVRTSQRRKETSCWMEAALWRQETAAFTEPLQPFIKKSNAGDVGKFFKTWWSVLFFDILWLNIVLLNFYVCNNRSITSVCYFTLQPLQDKDGKKCLFLIKSSQKSFEISASERKKKQEWIQGE